MSALLTAVGLHVAVDGRTLVDDVHLEVESGQVLTIIGPNGAGKTTLLRGLLGLQALSGGWVNYGDQPLKGLSARARGRFAAFVPQQLRQIPPLTVEETIALGRYPHRGPFTPETPIDRQRVREVVEACGLTPLLNRSLGTLSGGERQKVLLAGALAQDPQVLFLDEPTTGLDPGFQLDLVQLLRDWLRGGGALVVVSHELHLPGALGGRILALRKGQVVDQGSAVELLHAERLARIYDAPLVVAALGDAQTAVIPAFPDGSVAS